MRPFSPAMLVVAYIADLMFGDPEPMPHPVRLMGVCISKAERAYPPGNRRLLDFFNGSALAILLVAGSWTAGSLMVRLAARVHPVLAAVTETALAWTTLATGSLLSEANSVLAALGSNRLLQARQRLARIVGRDTESLSDSEIARALIETVAESLCDGVVAPLFYLSLAGMPAALAYKAANTLDSMIGHPEPPYTYFGRFAARLDDLLNFIPARLTAFVIVIAVGLTQRTHLDALKTWLRDCRRHPSPNAGQSEAAMAGALRVKLGGPNYYQGTPVPKPLLGSHYPAPDQHSATEAVRIARVASMIAFIAAFAWCLRARKI